MTADKKKNELPFMIGADPEFLAFYGRKSVHAQELLTWGLGKVRPALENDGYGYKIGKFGHMGWDGHNATGEMRPSAAKTPDELVANIGGMLKAVHEHLPFVDFSALSIGAAVGGHIHLDAGPDMYNDKTKARVARLVATFLLPIFASEHAICSGYRSSGSYGQPQDMRYQNVGTSAKMVLEIRGPSAEWTVSPRIAKATLCYIACVWQEIIKRSLPLSKTEIALKTEPQIKAAFNAILSDYRPMKDGLLKGIAETVRGFEFYDKYKEEIEFILDPKAVYAEKEKVGWNLMVGWGLTKEVKPKKKELMSEKIVAKKAKGVNMDLIDSSFSVSYNNDFNVSFFSEAISERVAGLGWKLKKEYFLFGLKKGVEGFLANDADAGTFFNVPSNINHKTINSLTQKLVQKYGSQKRVDMIRIDPKTGHTRKGMGDVVIIGLPYEMRQHKDVKHLVELIWKIENNKLEAKKLADYPDVVESPKVKGQEMPEELERILSASPVEIASTSIHVDLEPAMDQTTAQSYRATVAAETSVEEDTPAPNQIFELLQLRREDMRYISGEQMSYINAQTPEQLAAIVAQVHFMESVPAILAEVYSRDDWRNQSHLNRVVAIVEKLRQAQVAAAAAAAAPATLSVAPPTPEEFALSEDGI